MSKKTEVREKIQKDLFALADPGYRDFHAKLMPTISKETIIGVRTPALRNYAKHVEDAEIFLSDLPHAYYEENNLHGFLIEREKDFDTCISKIDAFLPYVDNWATCDLMSPKVFRKNRTELLEHCKRWMAEKETYTIRFGMETLMTHFLDEDFKPEYLDMVASVHSREYYVNMMIAWFFATALAKQYKATLPFLEEQKLEVWTHNKTIQKAIESYRVKEEQKEYLRTLKRKKDGTWQ